LGGSLWKSHPSFVPHTGVSTLEASALIRPPINAINIAHFEALAIPWALEAFIKLLPTHSHIVWAVDNQNVLFGFKGGFARVDYIAKQIDIFMNIVCKYKLWIEFVWVPSAINMEPDQFSRLFIPTQEWELQSHYWDIFVAQCKNFSWPLPTVDAFASANNAKCTKYFALHRDGKAVGSFFFSQLLQHEVYWIFAPFVLVSKILHKLQVESVCAWMLLPRWTSRPWWQVTNKATIQYTFCAHPQFSLFSQLNSDCSQTPINPEYHVDVWFFDFRIPKVQRYP